MIRDFFDPDGWVDMAQIEALGQPFTWVWGGRGTGKTYGALKYYILNNVKFILMRRTVQEVDLMSSIKALSPFEPLNRDMGWNYRIVKQSKFVAGVYPCEEADGKSSPCGDPIGVVLPLSGVANIRGFDGSSFQALMYDEYIPENHVRRMKDEASAFFNAYETLNRNRELVGEPALKMVGFSNSNRLDNDLFVGLGLVSKAYDMVRKRQTCAVLRDRATALVNLEDSPIAVKKADTALYKMSKGTAFADMALQNKFIGEGDGHAIAPQPLREFVPIVVVGELCIYKHRSQYRYYATRHISGSPPKYAAIDTDLKRFRRDYAHIKHAYLLDTIKYDERISQALLTKYLDI